MTIEAKEEQCWKALYPILVTELGILIDFRDVQFSKAHLSIFFTDVGIFIDVREVQYLYLQPIITQYFIDNKSEIWLLFLIAHSKR